MNVFDFTYFDSFFTLMSIGFVNINKTRGHPLALFKHQNDQKIILAYECTVNFFPSARDLIERSP